MPKLKIYDLFLSHVWREEENSEYYRLEKLLNDAPNFKWRNYSVPEHDPLGTETDRQLSQALDQQISPINCFLVVSGMYVNYREWIQKEIDIAIGYGKPIIGVIPWDQKRIPTDVQDVADEMVGWRTSSIVSAIRKWSI